MNRNRTRKPARKAGSVKASASVTQALAQSRDVKDKIGQCADDLNHANHQVKAGMAQGSTLVAAQQVLAHTESVESKTLECVEELHEVNETLIDGVDELKRIERALAQSRADLAASQLALAHALETIEKVRDLALHDGLTGLPLRELFEDRLGYAIALAARKQWNIGVLFLDLDGFKAVNDTLGHAAGDEVLTVTAKRLTHRLRFADTVCRYGGDEFLLLLMNPQAEANVERIAREVLAEISTPIVIDGAPQVVGASLGIAMYPGDGTDSRTLIQKADAAMYAAKKRRSRIAFIEAVAAA